MLPFSNPLSDSILSFGHDDLGHAVDPNAIGDQLKHGQYAGLLHGTQGANCLRLGKAQCAKERPCSRLPHPGAVFEEREQPDFGSDVALVIEDIGGTNLPRLEAPFKQLIPHDGRKNKKLSPSSGKGHLFYGRCRAFGCACPGAEPHTHSEHLFETDPMPNGYNERATV